MSQLGDRRIVAALLGCVAVLLLALLGAMTLLGGVALIALRGPARPVTATINATATPSPTVTLTAPPLATRPRAGSPTVARSAATPGTGQLLRTIDLAANDLAYDPFSGQLWASVPGNAGELGNSVVPLDPATGAIGTPIFVGSEPARLALSDDGHYLYVALDGAAAVRRVDLWSRTADIQFPLGSDKYSGTYYAEDLAVLPGKAEAVAVSRMKRNVSPRHGGVAIYVDGKQLPNETPDHTGANVIEFCGAADTLYGYNNETSEYGFRRMGVDSAGVAVRSVGERLIAGYYLDIRCDAGLVYATSGQIVDTKTMSLAGSVQGLSGNTVVCPDSSVGRVFFLTQIGAGRPGEVSSAGSGPSGYRLLTFDQRTYRQLWSLDLAGGTSAAPSPRDAGRQPGALVRWGADGLAFRAGAGQIYLVQSPIIGGGTAPSATATTAPGALPQTAAPRPSTAPPPPPPRPPSPTLRPPTATPAAGPPAATTPAGGAAPGAGGVPALPTPAARLHSAATLTGHDNLVRAVAWSPDGSILASGATDKSVRLWRADGTPIATLAGHVAPVQVLAWSPDSARLATSAFGNDPTVRLWGVDGGTLFTIQAHEGGVNGVAWSPDGRFLVSFGNDRTVKLWTADGVPLKTFSSRRWPVQRVAWSPDSAAFAFVPGDSTVEVWSTAGALLATFRGHQEPADVARLAWSPRGDLLASGDGFGNVLFWKPDGALVRTLVGNPDGRGAGGGVADLAWSPDGDTVAVLDYQGGLHIWTAAGAPRYSQRIAISVNGAGRIAWSPDGATLAANNPGDILVLLRVADRAILALDDPRPDVYCLTWSPDSKTLTTGGVSTIQLWR